MRRDILILLAVAAVVLLVNLGSGSLNSWDEAFYAQVSREILEQNDWVNMHWTGKTWIDKPPLYMWFTALFYKLFGVTEFAARLFSAIAGMGLVIFTYLLGRRLFSRNVGIISALMLLGSYHFISFSKAGTMDITNAFFVCAAMYFFVMGENDRRNLILSFLCFSLAFLTKSFGAMVIPMILGIYVIVGRKWHLVFNRYFAIGATLALVIVGSWHLTVYMQYGDRFVQDYILKHLVARTSVTLDGHEGGLLSYINVILYKAKPWGAVGLVVLPFFIFFSIWKKERENYLLIVWIFVLYALFTTIRTKLHWYIMPIYPAVMLVGGWGMDKLLKKKALIVTVIIFIGGMAYLGIKKDIFTLDYNPEIKQLATSVSEVSSDTRPVYLYRIGDPGMQFYFGGGLGKNIQYENEIVTGEDGAVIVSRQDELDKLDIKGQVIPSGRDDLTAIIIE
ncbi:ArnT family glycosyltransferase [Candidatus Omnitrophota bacterium]